MSDNHEHNGGHELENIDSTSLLAQMIALFVVVFIAVIAVAQWFYKQRDELALERAKDGYAFAKEQRAVEDEMLQGIDDTTKAILKSPKKLKAAAPPEGWIHPDDLAGGGAAAAPAAVDSDALVGDEADGEKADDAAEAAPGDKPAEAVKAEGDAAPAEAAKAEDAKADDAKAEAGKGDAAKADDTKTEKTEKTEKNEKNE
jgi:type IV secretory pathway VirB10-like protein